MKKFVFALTLIILLSSLVVAEDTNPVSIILNQQPSGTYNLGDSFSIPLTLKSLIEVAGTLQMDLICGGKSTNFYKNGVKLSAGQEQRMNAVLVLTKENIGFTKGTCKVKTIFGTQYILSDDFTISDVLTITLKSGEGEFKPSDKIVVEGEVTKENGELVNGFIELGIFSGNDSQNNYVETVNNGFFAVDLSLPAETPAGPYLISLSTYEKDLTGEVTNKGFLDYTITILQVPTSLEVLFENLEIEPGTNLRVKAILHDQTGTNIDGTIAIITIKDKDNKILHQIEKPTNEFLDYSIKYSEPPANWTVYAISTQLNGEAKAIIKEKKEVKYELANKTLAITNVGNVIYNDTVFIKIGEEVKDILVYLEIDESRKFTLSAPEGEYDIEIVKEEGSELIGRVGLTGKTVDIEEAKAMIGKIFNPFVWIFIIAICGFVAFMYFKKGYRRSFIGYVKAKKNSLSQRLKKKDRFPRKSSQHLKNDATLSLSIKGDKQDASIVCLKIKNLEEIKSEKHNTNIIQEIINSAKDKKAVLYESGEYFFFILAPIITKTFKNERTAIDIARSIQNSLMNHNQKIEKKIEFGISINHGAIIAKKEGEELKFMNLKTFVPKAKKIATMSDQEVLLTGEMNERLLSVGGVRTDKVIRNGIKFYTIKEMRDTSGDKTFISGFMKRMERENK